MKMLSGILHPTEGHALVNGFVPWERKVGFRRSMAFVAGQKSQLWVDLPAEDSFYLNKCIYEIPDEEYKRNVWELTEMLDVQRLLKIQVRRLSLGEKMKMELIAALLHSPKVIFLDEPTIGLDIVSQNAMRDYLRKYNKKTGATILLTSHYTQDIEKVCSRTIVINHGVKVFDDSLDQLAKFTGDTKQIRLTFAQPTHATAFSSFGIVTQESPNTVFLEVMGNTVDAVIREATKSAHIADISIQNAPIETCIERIFKDGGAQ